MDCWHCGSRSLPDRRCASCGAESRELRGFLSMFEGFTLALFGVSMFLAATADGLVWMFVKLVATLGVWTAGAAVAIRLVGRLETTRTRVEIVGCSVCLLVFLVMFAAN